MFDVAKNLATHSLKRMQRVALKRAHEPSPSLFYRLLERLWLVRGSERAPPTSAGGKAELRANVIFLTWCIPDLLTNNLFALIPAYYKTVANYDQILESVAATVSKFIEFAELSRSSGAGWSSEPERARYYAGFEFYGHSLGSHIVTDAIQRVRQRVGRLGGPWAKFGKLAGLDPATPCFLSLEHGISASKVANVVEEIVVVHSNAGLAGLTSDRAYIEIVLNGGTFQPGCAWYDFGCHHSRSTDILQYRDDECQMVAYKCVSYHHFKTGACETCDHLRPPLEVVNSSLGVGRVGAGGLANHQAVGRSRNCVLVNMEEQHFDSDQMMAFVESRSGHIRQLAGDNDDAYKQRPADRGGPLDWIVGGDNTTEHAANLENSKRSYYHYVKTNPNFRLGRKSHCLQHYQLRLIILGNEVAPEVLAKCRLSNFYSSGDQADNINLNLFYELNYLESNYKPSAKDKSTQAAQRRMRSNKADGSGTMGRRSDPKGIQLGAIIRDLFHSALVTFERQPKLFVGAELDNLKLNELKNCYRNAGATSGPTLVLDIAFMSHTSERVRQAFSSLLCGQLELGPAATGANETDGDSASGQTLELRLCRATELRNVSREIDKLLERIKLQRLDETWKVSLLNNLFSLFAEWEPF